LARGEIQCIGATTFDEYKKSIEKDGALSRRFQKLILPEPSEAETVQILTNLKDSYESFHKVKYEDGVVECIVKLSKRFMTDRQFPDKAIDIMDELGSEKKISNKAPEILDKLKRDIELIKEKKLEVVKSQDYEKAASLRDNEKKIMEKLEEEKNKWLARQQNNRIPINLEDVYEIISNITGVPITKLDSKETEKLLNMEKLLGAKIIGQDDAISVISKCIRRNRVGIKDTNKPIGSFIFLGSTGVGKTYLAKSLAELLFGDPEKIIRIDMSEYMDKQNVSKLIGSPPGYVGYDEGGQLTEKVKNNPFSVILFDEIEKAHKDVYNMMLQILDDGHLTDSFGRKVNFTNTLIIMTSNVGTRKVSEFGAGLGFATASSEQEKDNVKKSMIQKSLKQQFPPEFINRIDDIILFNSLNEDSLKKIIDVELNKLKTRLKDKNYLLSFDKTISQRVFELNSQEEYGARPIKRIIQNLCEDFLSEEILKGNIVENEEFTIKFKDGKLFIKKK
jgi:ATP-dependent Clp protease ATP-binding subunit ClpC